jgi:hypothetical protein
MSKPCVPVILFYSGLYRLASLSNNVHLTTDAVNPQSPQSQVILHGTKEDGDLWFVKGHLLSWFLLVHNMEGITVPVVVVVRHLLFWHCFIPIQLEY